MNCCNDFGQCTQGFGCPVRTTPIAQVVEERDTLDSVVGWIRNLLAAIGLVATACVIGLHAGGLFHYLAKRSPDNAVLQFFFS